MSKNKIFNNFAFLQNYEQDKVPGPDDMPTMMAPPVPIQQEGLSAAQLQEEYDDVLEDEDEDEEEDEEEAEVSPEKAQELANLRERLSMMMKLRVTPKKLNDAQRLSTTHERDSTESSRSSGYSTGID